MRVQNRIRATLARKKKYIYIIKKKPYLVFLRRAVRIIQNYNSRIIWVGKHH